MTAELGSAVVEFVAVVGLLTVLFLGVLQVALVVHVRNTLVDCAAEGARYGGLVGRNPAQGAARTQELIRSALGPGYARDVRPSTGIVDGLPVIEIRVGAALPALGLIPVGHRVEVVGRGLDEAALNDDLSDSLSDDPPEGVLPGEAEAGGPP